MRLKPCPHCDSNEVYERPKVNVAGSSGPDLLPGLGAWYTGAKATVVVCGSCGLMRVFASPEARAKMSESEKWTRVT
jgi:hypothetical protein